MATKQTTDKTSDKAVDKPQATGDTGALATTQQGAVAVAGDGFADFAGQGMQDLGKDDLAIPFLTILQSGAPQVKRSDGAYVEGAAEGMLFNTVTKECIDPIKTPVIVVACFYERHFVEWRVREAGGGFVKQHPPLQSLMDDTIRDEKGRDVTKRGTQLNDTRTFYVLVLDSDGMPSPALLTMTSTQIKKAKQWLMQQNLLKLRGPSGPYTPPMFASKWRITTVPESNEKGTWMGWAFTHDGYLAGKDDPVFLAAKKFYDDVQAGTVKVDLAKAEGTDPNTGERRQPVADDDKDIPF